MVKRVFSASVLSADLMRLEEDLEALRAGGCDELHFDVSDGRFCPNFGPGADFIKAVRERCPLPCVAHLLVTNPEDHARRFVEAGCASVIVHIESCQHAHNALTRIREAGGSPGIALNPGTPLFKVDYLLDHSDRVLFMNAEPGTLRCVAPKITFERMRILKENIDYRGLRVRLGVEVGVDVSSAALFARGGAEIFVLDKTSGVFRGGEFAYDISRFKTAAAETQKLV